MLLSSITHLSLELPSALSYLRSAPLLLLLPPHSKDHSNHQPPLPLPFLESLNYHLHLAPSQIISSILPPLPSPVSPHLLHLLHPPHLLSYTLATSNIMIFFLPPVKPNFFTSAHHFLWDLINFSSFNFLPSSNLLVLLTAFLYYILLFSTYSLCFSLFAS